jgi:tryptophan 2,3-dioxygenase
LAEPSLYDEVLRLLARRGLPVPADQIERDWTVPREPHPGVVAAWVTLYRNVEAQWDLYELAEKLIDLEHVIGIWRHHHATTVERVIGYLRRAVFRRFFPELWDCRTEL